MKPHRSESSHPRLPSEFHDDNYSRSSSRQSHRSHRSSRYDDPYYGNKRDHYSYSHRPTTYYPTPDMYTNTKSADPTILPPYRRRHSHSPQTTVARTYDDESDSDSASASPPRHARPSRSNRTSTFPPSAYHMPASQKQVQPYQRLYVHPALPPASPALPPSDNTWRHCQMTPRSSSPEDEPRYTYQPPTYEPPRHPAHLRHSSRTESWSHSSSSRSESRTRPPSRRGTMSEPPSMHSSHDASSRKSVTGWQKAKKVAQSKTASNTAEIAMFGLLALSKAL